jgi:hypothetical protein
MHYRSEPGGLDDDFFIFASDTSRKRFPSASIDHDQTG